LAVSAICIREAGSGWALHSGSQAGSPVVWVSACRTVIASLPLAANSGT
jgi:hypothetical protein